MSWGSKQSTQTQQQQQQNQSGSNSNTSTPNLPPWLQSAFQGFTQQGQNLSAAAQQPVFGQAQQASYLQNLNDLANQSTAKLSSTLASKGVTNSGAMAQGATDIQTQRLGSEAGFLSQVPFLNQQATLQNEEGALASGVNAAKAVPYGSTSTGTSSGQSNMTGSSDSTTTQTPGLASLVTALGGAALGGMTGGASMLGGLGGGLGGATGGSKSMPAGQVPNPVDMTSQFGAPFGGSGFSYNAPTAPFAQNPTGGL